MTEPENNITPFEEVPVAPPADKPKLYSKRAIRVFSILFSTLAGGFLLRQNLKDIGNDKVAHNVITFSIIYTLGTIIVNYYFSKEAGAIALLLNIIGSFILNEYFFHDFIGDSNNYGKKPIWKPLIICLLITSVVILIVIYTGALK